MLAAQILRVRVHYHSTLSHEHCVWLATQQPRACISDLKSFTCLIRLSSLVAGPTVVTESLYPVQLYKGISDVKKPTGRFFMLHSDCEF